MSLAARGSPGIPNRLRGEHRMTLGQTAPESAESAFGIAYPRTLLVSLVRVVIETFGEMSAPETLPQRFQLATEFADLRSQDLELRSEVLTIVGYPTNVQIVGSFPLSPSPGS